MGPIMDSTNTIPAPTDPVVTESPAVFVDDSGRRSRNMKRTGWIASILCAAFLGIVGVGLAVENVAPPAGLPLAVPAPIQPAPVVAPKKATQQQAAPRRQVAAPSTASTASSTASATKAPPAPSTSAQLPTAPPTATQPAAGAPASPPAAANAAPTNTPPVNNAQPANNALQSNAAPGNTAPGNTAPAVGTQPAAPNTQGQ